MRPHKLDILKIPKNLEGMSFLDVGCWEGASCVEAVRRGASPVWGVDLCVSPGLRTNIKESRFGFVQNDVMSEQVLMLPLFDIVLCSGVIYHCEDPLRVIRRLRSLTKCNGLLFLETIAVNEQMTEDPKMYYYPSGLADDPSTNWVPTIKCAVEMVRAAGFSAEQARYLSATPHQNMIRLCIKATAIDTISIEAANPRKPAYMEIEGGSRG